MKQGHLLLSLLALSYVSSSMASSAQSNNKEFIDMIVTNPKAPSTTFQSKSFSARSFAESVDLTLAYEDILTNDPLNVRQFYLRSNTLHYIVSDGVYYGDFAGTSAMEAWALDTAPDNNRVRVMVIDGGFYNNPELNFVEGVNFIEPNQAQSFSANGQFFDSNYLQTDIKQCAADDIDNHGTQISGLIAATRNNAIGIAGAASNIDLVAVNALNCGVGFLSSVIRGILYGAQITDSDLTDDIIPQISEPVDVINLSLAGATSQCPAALQEAINLATQKGIVLVSSAGNSSDDASGYYPGNCENVINVGGTNTTNHQPWSFTNTGEDVDIHAPAVTPALLSGPNDEFESAEGTSQSAPLVSAAAAMIKRNVPDADYAEIDFVLKATANIMENGEYTLNTLNAMKNALARNAQSAGRITHAADGNSSCSSNALVNAFNARTSICTKAKVTFLEGSSVSDGREYQLIDNQNGDIVLTSNTTTAYIDISDIDTDGEYTFNSCQDGECITSPLNFTIDITIPSSCL